MGDEGTGSIVGFHNPPCGRTGDHEVITATALCPHQVMGFEAMPFRRATAVRTTNLLNCG